MFHYKPGVCELALMYPESPDATLTMAGCKAIGKYDPNCFDNSWSCPKSVMPKCELFLKYDGVRKCEEKK
jgi:hypothetical protein